jgi:chemotaxis methyl-accepting protein methylase
MHLLGERSGHDFQHYKRATVLRRIERRMQVSRQPALPADATYLQASPQETVPLLQDMLISVINFFRDRPAFDALERLVSEGHFDNRLPAERVPAWVAVCATGEEACSVAMCCWSMQVTQVRRPACRSLPPTLMNALWQWRSGRLCRVHRCRHSTRAPASVLRPTAGAIRGQ